MKRIYTIIILMCLTTVAFSQEKTISGFVYNKQSGDPLAAANVVVKETQKGAVTADNGYFVLKVTGSDMVTIQVTYVGFKNIEVEAMPGAKNVIINMEPSAIMGEEFVVSASRIPENIRTAPLTIQKLNELQIDNSPSGDYFQDLGNLKDVEVINNSLGFRVFNARGFNSTAPLRVVQFIDGVDNQLPTINIVPGNMFGTSDIDIRNIEVISGPASALYGPNAMQGVISYETKDPWDFPGVSAQVKGGNREYMDVQFRAANTFFNDKFGVKIVGSYMKAKDWQSDWMYGKAPANPGIQSKIMGQILQDPSYAGFNAYMMSNPSVAPFTKVMMPGYTEEELFDGKIDNLKVAGTIYYKFAKDIQAKYNYSYAEGTAFYMGNNRAPLEGFNKQLHSLELKAKGFTLHAYRTSDDTKNTYSLDGVGMNLGFAALGGVDAKFLPAYVNEIQSLSNGFTVALTPDQINQAVAAGSAAAADSWLKPGTDAFNTAFNKIKDTPPPFGGHYTSKTVIYHVGAMYEYSFDKVDVNMGASFRNTNPESNGTVYNDANQSIDVSEYGGFIQGIAHLSDDMTKLYGSVRLDKSDNYDLQFSPRVAVVTTVGNHNFRLTAQSAFRAPAITDQYQYLNRGRDIVAGNIDGFGNCYTQSSINAYYANNLDSTLLVPTAVAAVKPEQVKSLEFGYNGTFFDKLYVDFSAYYSRYSDFIAYQQVGRPNTGEAGQQSGIDAMRGGDYQKFSVATNVDQDVDTYGASIGLSYYLNDKIAAYVNYTYSNIDSVGIDTDVIPGFNTPKHKVNLGLKGNRVYKNLGFVVNWKWVDEYYWSAVFASGPVPAYNTLDLQLNYALPKIYSVFRIGGSNILGEEYIQAYAMPQIGAFWYASWTFDLNFK